MDVIFMQLGLILLIVLGVSIVMRIFRQPLIIGYILSGIIVGPLILDLIHDGQTFQVFSEIGISFLLFIVGLHLSPRVIKDVGKVSLITGIGQIVFTSLIGFGIGMLAGFSVVTSLYIAIALTFSSTIIIMKLLSDKDALGKLYGKVSIGFLLVQDLVAIFVLIIVSSLTSGSGSTLEVIASLFLKGGVLVLILVPITIYALPKLSSFFAKSQEFLFLFAIAWGFGLSLLFVFAGFSIEVGALIAGVMLSMSPYNYEISSKLKPLRDFFIISFFIVLGSQMTFGNISHLVVPAVIFSLFILIGNPLIVMTLMGFLGYSRKTGFMAGLTVAQISEFSLILIALGVKTGSLGQEILSFVTIIGLITIAGSTYLIMYSEFIFNKISRLLAVFERKNIREKDTPKRGYDYILMGYNTIGFSIIKAFTKLKKDFVVIDYDPEIIKDLNNRGIPAIYGDVDDFEFLEDLELDQTSLIVSTIPDRETNRLLLDFLRAKGSRATILISAREINDAFELYGYGADYVILPYFLGGEYTAKLIEKAKSNKRMYKKERRKEEKTLKERLSQGHKHPRIERSRGRF